MSYPFSPETVSWMLEHGLDPAEPNKPGRYQDTPLILASRLDHEEVVAELLAAGVDVNHRNMDGTNALWAAVVGSSFRVAERLVEAGIDTNNRNDNGATALMYAASAGKPEWVAWLLGHDVDTNAQTLDGFTALDLASNVICLKLLRHHKATPATAD